MGEETLLHLIEHFHRRRPQRAQPQGRAITLMACYTGMRRGELFRLKWTHIDVERGFITLQGEDQGGAKSNRDEHIPLTKPVRKLLERVRSIRASERRIRQQISDTSRTSMCFTSYYSTKIMPDILL